MLAIVVITQVQLFRRWLMAGIRPVLEDWYKVRTTSGERAALAALAREAPIVARQELPEDPGADLLKLALADVESQLSRWALTP